jgi:hypothetical protein
LLQTLLHEYLLVPWKGFLQLELPQQHGAVYESIDCASWVITCCTCPPSSALLHYQHCCTTALLKEQCREACLNTSTSPGSPCNTILRAPVCCMPLCFHTASFFV